MSSLASSTACEYSIFEPYRKVINTRADGWPATLKTRFLLAHLFLDALRDDLNVPAVNKRLAEIQRDVRYAQPLSDDGNDWKRQLLRKAYDKVLDRIKMQEHGDLAMEILGWITHAKRPLKAHELITAVSLNHHGQPDSDMIYEPADIVSACGGLIVLDDTSRIVRLSHYATQESFKAIAKTCFPNAHYKISGACAAYLTFFGP